MCAEFFTGRWCASVCSAKVEVAIAVAAAAVAAVAEEITQEKK